MNKKTWKPPMILELVSSIESGNFCAGSMEGAYYMMAGPSRIFNTPMGGTKCFGAGVPFTYDNCAQTMATATVCS